MIKALTGAGLLLLASTVGGCVVAGALAYKVFGPPATPARFTLGSPVLVLVENSHSSSVSLPEADELASTIKTDLEEHKIGPVLDLRQVYGLRERNPISFSRMSISEIGRRAGARQVVYVSLREFQTEAPQGSEVAKLRMGAVVKVIDSQSAQMLWPDSGDGEPVDYESSYVRLSSESTTATLRREAMQKTGLEIARFFYPYQAETMGEENKDLKLR